MGYVLLGEDAAAARLGTEPVELRIAPVDRDLEPLGKLDLVGRHAEGEDHRELGLADVLLDPPNGTRPGEELA